MTTLVIPTLESGPGDAATLADNGLDTLWERIQHFDGPALISADATITFAELRRLTQESMVRLDRCGEGDVTVVAHKTPEVIAMILACFVTNRSVLLPSPTLPPATVDELATVSGCRSLVDPTTPLVLAPANPRAGRDRPMTIPVVNSAAVLLATSGSTGTPKLVPLPRSAVSAFITWAGAYFGLRPGAVTLSYAPLSFDLSLLDVWAALAHGAATVLIRPNEAIRGKRLVELLERHRVTTVQAVPMAFRIMEQGSDGVTLSHVRHVMFTGDRTSSDTLGWIRSTFPRARHFNIYGCTETNDSFIHEVLPTEVVNDDIPIGHPLPGVEALLLDAERRRIAGAGRGELWVSTPFQTSGYLDPRHTAERMEQFVVDGRLRTYVRSGDVVERDHNGLVRIRGRTDNQVKVRGVAVNTDAVEHVLRLHPAVGQAAVLAVAEPLSGTRLVAVIQRKPGHSLDTLGVKTHLLSRLSTAAVPETFVFCEQPLPTTSTGKIDRRRIHTDLVAGHPSPTITTKAKDTR